MPAGLRRPPLRWPTHDVNALAMGELLRNVKLLQSRADQPPLHELTLDDFPLGRPGSARNAFYGVPDETTEGVYAAALTPLLRDLTAGAGLGVMRLGSSARHRQLLEGLSPHDIALIAAGLVPSLGVEPLRRQHVLHVQQGDRGSGPNPPVPAEATLVACIHGVHDQRHTVWVAEAAELLEGVKRQAPALAPLLLEPVFTHAVPKCGLSSLPRQDGAGVGVFELGGHIPSRALRAAGVPVLKESNALAAGEPRAERPLQRHVRAPLGDPPKPCPVAPWAWAEAVGSPGLARLCTVSSATADHVLALSALRELSADAGLWTALELQLGDILLADSSVVLCHQRAEDEAEAGEDGQGEVQVYEELRVLQQCADAAAGARQVPHPRPTLSSSF